jgi:hypothetical protein
MTLEHTILRDQLKEIADTVLELVQNEYLYFDTAVSIKLSPHSRPDNFWAICVSPANDVYIMNAGEEWFRIEACDRGAETVIGSLYQRIKLIQQRYKILK